MCRFVGDAAAFRPLTFCPSVPSPGGSTGSRDQTLCCTAAWCNKGWVKLRDHFASQIRASFMRSSLCSSPVLHLDEACKMRTRGSTASSGSQLAGCGQGSRLKHHEKVFGGAGFPSSTMLLSGGDGNTRARTALVVRSAVHWGCDIPTPGACSMWCARAVPWPASTTNPAGPVIPHPLIVPHCPWLRQERAVLFGGNTSVRVAGGWQASAALFAVDLPPDDYGRADALVAW